MFRALFRKLIQTTSLASAGRGRAPRRPTSLVCRPGVETLEDRLQPSQSVGILPPGIPGLVRPPDAAAAVQVQAPLQTPVQTVSPTLTSQARNTWVTGTWVHEVVESRLTLILRPNGTYTTIVLDRLHHTQSHYQGTFTYSYLTSQSAVLYTTQGRQHEIVHVSWLGRKFAEFKFDLPGQHNGPSILMGRMV
jgi:hypothetical protein